MKRISLLREKSFKELKLWNYRTLLMFLAISIIIFFLLLLVSGCKSDTAEHLWEKPFTTKLNQEITGCTKAQAATTVNGITVKGQRPGNFVTEINGKKVIKISNKKNLYAEVHE